MAGLMDILSGAGAALDTPGAMVRNTLSGRNPLQPLSNPFSWEGRATGRDLLQQYGLAGQDPSGANMAGGYLAEVALDPLAWGGVGMLSRALGMGAKGARAAGTAGQAAGQAAGLAAPATRAAAPPAGRTAKAMAMSVAPPAAGAYMIGDNMNDPEGQQGWKNVVGTGLMLSPLLGMAKGVAMPVAKLLEIPLDQLTKNQRQRLNNLARRKGADPAVLKRVEEMHQRDIRTKPTELMTEAEMAAAKDAFREAGAAGGRPTGSRLSDELLRERLPKLEAELESLKGVNPKTLSEAERTARSSRMQRLRADISRTKKRTAEPSPQATDPTVLTPETQAAPPTPPTEGAGPMVTLNEAFTEHYDHMENYLRKTFRDKGFNDPNTLDDLTQEAMTRVLISAQKRTDVAFPAGEAGWKALEPFVKKRAIDAMRTHLKPGRGTAGTAGSREDAYKLGRFDEEGLGPNSPSYEARVGRMSTVADKAPTPAQQAQLNELPQVFDIVQELSKGSETKPIYFDALFEDRFMLDKLRASRQPYKAPDWQKMADKIGVTTRTAYNWTKEFAQRLEAMGVNLEAYRDILPMLLAALGLGGAAGGAVAWGVVGTETPEAASLSVPPAGPFEFATLDGQPISSPYV